MAAGLPARVLAVIAQVHPTSAQRWVAGSVPRGPALRRLRRAARIARSWPTGALPLRQWMSAPAVLLGDRSPAAWIGGDSEDLPLAEAWREATGASAASLGRVFPDLAEVRAGDRTVRDASLLVVARAALDMERAGIGPLMEVIQDNLKTVSSNAAITSSKTKSPEDAEALREQRLLAIALHKSVARVTGSGRDIGRAITLGLADAGARVTVLARSADQVEQTVFLIDEHGKSGLAVPADVNDPDQVDAALRAIRDSPNNSASPHPPLPAVDS
jgi:hypothetical protein